jgi:hypothetical protein
MIKRQMYGRAGFDLLRKRVTLHPASPDHKIRGRANYVIVNPSELGNYKIADKSAATAMRSLTGDAILPCSARLNSETPSVLRLCRTAVPRVLALTD